MHKVERSMVKTTREEICAVMFGARVKIMWEEQLVDPPIHYITFPKQTHPSRPQA